MNTKFVKCYTFGKPKHEMGVLFERALIVITSYIIDPSAYG